MGISVVLILERIHLAQLSERDMRKWNFLFKFVLSRKFVDNPSQFFILLSESIYFTFISGEKNLNNILGVSNISFFKFLASSFFLSFYFFFSGIFETFPKNWRCQNSC